ncbi:hypothetical protein HLPR_01510 [Helicovermis profundi]|uniref:Uncharacterized protein n=1 Tax=Helicovermis profundi TaxID=3065157 RepID=A0AAU9EMZ8_9FIRM|nr:hypothetical protein HLPR_01510 [Clostridia bacterium S502]
MVCEKIYKFAGLSPINKIKNQLEGKKVKKNKKVCIIGQIITTIMVQLNSWIIIVVELF